MNEDRAALDKWWRAVRATAPARIAGLWFGLAELADEDGFRLYVAGTETFDASDETAEWAVGPYAWWPEERYSPMEFPTEDPFGALDAAQAVIRELRPWEHVSVEGVAVGFDDGDFMVVEST